jgi:hypothetical protein
MGRLIDADGLKANVQGWYAFMREIKQIHMTLGEKDFIAKIDNAETVEAIPKERIEQILEHYKLQMPPTVYYDLLADVRNYEEEET